MKNMKKLLKRFLKDEQGLETVEYAMIAGIIVVGTLITVVSIGTWVNGRFTSLDNDLSTH